MKRSAGLLLYYEDGEHTLHFFLVHPGGPFFAKRNNGVWTIPKGMVNENEDELTAAMREFLEETGLIGQAPFIPLGTITQKGSKLVTAWAFRGKWDPSHGIKSNTFELEWPPRSGIKRTFPEVDEGKWFTLAEAKVAIIREQIPFLNKLVDHLKA